MARQKASYTKRNFMQSSDLLFGQNYLHNEETVNF
jgi:hypothetical protein